MRQRVAHRIDQDEPMLVRLSTCALLGCALAGCATSIVSPVDSASASLARIVGAAPADCRWLLAVSATDGAVEPAADPSEGTRERAIAKLQRVAAAYGADTIVVDENRTLGSVALEGARGSEITLGADAYSCAAK